MCLAIMTDQGVYTRKKLPTKKRMTDDFRERMEFIRNHDFSVEVLPSGECEVKVTQKETAGEAFENKKL